MNLPTAASLLLLAACHPAPDARKIARVESEAVISHISQVCGMELSAAANPVIEAQSNELEATSRFTLNSTSAKNDEPKGEVSDSFEEVQQTQLTCVADAVDTYQSSRTPRDRCEVGYSYPRGWTLPGAGMRMSVEVDCLPHYLD